MIFSRQLSKMDKCQRSLLGKQPARLLLVDSTIPFISGVIDDICDAVENLFAVACNFGGPSRIPFFSIVMAHDYQKPLLPFSYVKNNFQRIQTAVSDMRTMMYASCQTNRLDVEFDKALLEVCNQYKKQQQPSLQSSGFSVSLEIVILTAQNDKTVQKQVETAVRTLDLGHTKKIQVLCLTQDTSFDDDIFSPSDRGSQGSLVSNNSGHSGHSNDSGLVEMVKLDQDILYLQNFFNSWLLDTNTDSEHLHLILPPTGKYASPLVIKCDLQERVLHPAQLPFNHNFTLNSDASAMKIVFPSNSKAMGMTIPVYKLKIIGQVPLSSVCDSVVFGMPMIAQATSCWKIDWDELEKHQQNFKALHYSLYQREYALIAHLLPEEMPVNKGNRSRQTTKSKADQPTGNFVLIPSKSGSMLIKCLAVGELLLPYSTLCDIQVPAEDYVDFINRVLDKVDVLPGYNPVHHSSGVYEYLRSTTSKTTTTTQRQTKKQTEKVENCTNKMVLSSSSKQTPKPLNFTINSFETDTPLFQRPIKSHSTNSKRKLYSSSDTVFMEEMGDNDLLDFSEKDIKHQGKRRNSFPTHL